MRLIILLVEVVRLSCASNIIAGPLCMSGKEVQIRGQVISFRKWFKLRFLVSFLKTIAEP